MAANWEARSTAGIILAAGVHGTASTTTSYFSSEPSLNFTIWTCWWISSYFSSSTGEAVRTLPSADSMKALSSGLIRPERPSLSR